MSVLAACLIALRRELSNEVQHFANSSARAYR